MTGPSAFVYGGDSVVNAARALMKAVKQHPDISLKGAVLDGNLFEGEAGVKRLSDFPTKEEAQAKVVQLVLAPGANVLGAGVPVAESSVSSKPFRRSSKAARPSPRS